MTDRNRIYAITATALTALVVLLLLLVVDIHVDNTPREWPPVHHSEIVLDEEYVEVLEVPLQHKASTPRAADNDIAQVNQSTPGAEQGPDVTDVGPQGPAPSTVTQTRPSPVQATTTPAQPDKGAVDPEAAAREEARRRAAEATRAAFDNARGRDNAASAGRNPGDSGSPGATGVAGAGNGENSVTGGWRMPTYAQVPSTMLGSIKLRLTINAQGNVTDVKVIGGDAPAATNTDLINACIAEVRRHRFTRSDNNPPPQATATVTYRFK